MTLGERLTKLRKDLNLSQEEVAEKLNVTRQTVSKWELDQSTPDCDKIIPICRLYNISTDELLTGRKTDTLNDDMNYNLMSDREIKSKKAIAICESIFLFFLSLAWVIITGEIDNFPDSLIAVGFFLFSVLGVINLIYKFFKLPELSDKKIKKEKKKHIHKYDDVISIFFAIVYLVISFITGAWGITWILWIVYALVCEIVHIMLGEEKEDKNDDEND